jgi:hypothetical protein
MGEREGALVLGNLNSTTRPLVPKKTSSRQLVNEANCP